MIYLVSQKLVDIVKVMDTMRFNKLGSWWPNEPILVTILRLLLYKKLMEIKARLTLLLKTSQL